MHAFGEDNGLTWRCNAMMTYLNDHAPATFQALHPPLEAPGAIFPHGGTPFISPHREKFIGEIALCHLDTPAKLEKVQGLRGHINLPSGCRDAQFFEQEKKETNWVLCFRSSSTAS
jgi:hypothetical protein